MFCCSEMAYNIDEIKIAAYNEVFDEYSIPISEDGISAMLIQYCPWCGRRLPTSKREEWFSQLEALGFDDPLLDDNLPEKFRSSKWREHL